MFWKGSSNVPGRGSQDPRSPISSIVADSKESISSNFGLNPTPFAKIIFPLPLSPPPTSVIFSTCFGGWEDLKCICLVVSHISSECYNRNLNFALNFFYFCAFHIHGLIRGTQPESKTQKF